MDPRGSPGAPDDGNRYELIEGELLVSPSRLRLTGTFTDMRYNREGGDVLGHELRIVRARDGYQGALQFAEGAPGNLIIVTLRIVKDSVFFEIPGNSGETGQFEGRIGLVSIKGRFKYKSGAEEKVVLVRRKTYWN